MNCAIGNTNIINTKLIIDHDGTGALNNLVTITLKNVAYRTDLLTGLIANGNLVLDTSPTLIPISVSLPPKPCSVVFVAVVLSVLALLLPFIVLMPSKLPALIVQ
jgi:hypothetical protein